MNSTGSSSRMALFSSPYASAGVDGATTFRPGVWANMTSRLCECWAVSCAPAPPGVRITIGTATLPPNICEILAAWFTTMSIATRMKLIVMISTTGRRPSIAAPTPAPTKPSSEIGRLADALAAPLLPEAGGDLVGALEAADLLAHQEDALVARELLVERAPQRLAVGHVRHPRVSFRSPNGPAVSMRANCSAVPGSL